MRTLQSARAPDGQPASYEVRTEFSQEDGHYHTLVRAWCIECQQAFDLRWDTGGNHPDFIAKKFKQIGWQFDAYKPRRCVCPICMGARHDRFVKENNSLSEELMPKSNSANVPSATDAYFDGAAMNDPNEAFRVPREELLAAGSGPTQREMTDEAAALGRSGRNIIYFCNPATPSDPLCADWQVENVITHQTIFDGIDQIFGEQIADALNRARTQGYDAAIYELRGFLRIRG